MCIFEELCGCRKVRSNLPRGRTRDVNDGADPFGVHGGLCLTLVTLISIHQSEMIDTSSASRADYPFVSPSREKLACQGGERMELSS